MNSRENIVADLKQGGIQLSVGLLTANWMDLAEEIKLLGWADVRLLHFDVMDGRIWPKLTAGAPLVAGLRHTMLNDVHLLVADPEKHVVAFAEAGADLISFSVEYTGNIGDTLNRIEAAKNGRHPDRPILRGVSLNPETPVSVIEPFLERIDFVLLLAVGPTTGKQVFFEAVQEKMALLRNLKPELFITLDGGIRKDNIGDIAKYGPDALVTGSAIFDGKDAPGNLAMMQTTLRSVAKSKQALETHLISGDRKPLKSI